METGTWIDEAVVSYTPLNQEDRQTIQPIPITLYDSEPVYQQGKIISVNKKYMVYGIRGGCLRVINKFTAKRTLLKGHTQQLSDISFQNSDSHVLASVNKDGSLIVWVITEKESDGTVDYKKLVHLSQKEGQTRHYRRLRWHPTHPGLLFTVSNESEIDAWDIKKLREKGSTGEFIIDDTVPADAHTCVREACPVETHDIGISFDGRILATGGTEPSKVVLWNVPEGGIGKYEQIIDWAPHGSEPLNSLHFLGSSSNKDLEHFLITGGPCNQEFKVWSVQDIRQGSLRLLQTLSFKPNPKVQRMHWDEPPFLNVAEVDPSSSFLVVCNQKESTAWAIHIKTPYTNSEGDLDTRLDYLTEFELQQCVISFGLSTKPPSKGAQREDGGRADISVGLICIQTKTIQLWHLLQISPQARDSDKAVAAIEDKPKDKEKEKEAKEKEKKEKEKKEEAEKEEKEKKEKEEKERKEKEETERKEKEEKEKKERDNGPETASASAVDEARQKRRQQMLELMSKGEDAAEVPDKKEEKPSSPPKAEAVAEVRAELLDPAIMDLGASISNGSPSMSGLLSPAMLQSLQAAPLADDTATPGNHEAELETPADEALTAAPEAVAEPLPEDAPTAAESSAELSPSPAAEEAPQAPAPTSAPAPVEKEPEPELEPVPEPEEETEEEAKAADEAMAAEIADGASPAIVMSLKRQMEQMQRTQAKQMQMMQKMMKEQREDHHKQMEEMKWSITQQGQKHVEASFNHTKEQRQHMIGFHSQLLNSNAKQFQEMLRLLSERISTHTEQIRPQFAAMQKEMESKQKQFSEEMVKEVKKDIGQVKEQLGSYIKHQKDYNELVKQKTKDTVEAEQQRMHKLLETVSHTILVTVPEKLEEKFDNKLEQSVQKKILPVLNTSIEKNMDKTIREGMKLNFGKTLLPTFEAGLQKIFEQVRASLTSTLEAQKEEVARSLRPEVISPTISRALADQEHVISRAVSDQLNRVLPQAVEHVLQAHLMQVLPKMIQTTMTDVLTNMASSNTISSAAAAAEVDPEVEKQAIKDEVQISIKAGEYEAAFTKILSLSSIDMVEWLAEELNAKEVFTAQPPLTNAVILSLIQQLAFAMDSKTNLKLTWLQECVVSFNPDDPVTAPHVDDVLGQVVVMLESFFQRTTDPTHKKMARAVLMMLKSVIS